MFCCALAVSLGFAAGDLASSIVGLATLLPFFSHLRRVGFRHAITEPSAITIILLFYFFVFPLRGLVIGLSKYSDITIAHGSVSGTELAMTLLLASGATTVLVESYYFVRNSAGTTVATSEFDALDRQQSKAASTLASILCFLAITALLGLLFQYGGLRSAQSALLSHSKSASLLGEKSVAGSIWSLFAVPAVWCAAYVNVSPTKTRFFQVITSLIGAMIVLAELVVFGSRLNAMLACLGAWVIFYYSGRAIPSTRILILIPVVLLISFTVVSQRPGSSAAKLSLVEQYSRVAGYGVLDASLAVHQQPAEIRSKLTEPQRWSDLPAYFVPSFLWPTKPNLDQRRMDFFVAQAVGTQNDRTTGFPTTYITEAWLYDGWPMALVISILFGGILGWLHRLLVRRHATRRSPAALFTYCFVVTVAFTFYKDGDILGTFVGDARAAVYLGVAMLVTGVWGSARESSVPRLRPRDTLYSLGPTFNTDTAASFASEHQRLGI